MQGTEAPRSRSSRWSDAEKAAPLRQLLLEALGESAPADVNELSATQLRDRLLELDPLDVDWVKRVNEVCVPSCLF